MRPAGNKNPAVKTAERTRSRLSRTTASGNPTIKNAGRPGPRWTSTRTSGAASPTGARLCATLIGSPPMANHCGPSLLRTRLGLEFLDALLERG